MLSKLKYALLIFALGGFIVAAPSVAADDTDSTSEATDEVAADQIQVSPATNRVDLDAGTTTEYELYVRVPETLTGEAKFTVYATPYSVTNENYELSFDTETTYTQISRWITVQDDSGAWVEEATFTATPGEKKYIKYRVSTPEDIPAGSQYATLFVEMSAEDTGQLNTSGVQTVSRAGIVVYGTAEGDTRQTAEITDYSFDTFKTSGDLTATALIKNTGNTDFTATYKYTVSNIFGKEIWSNDDDDSRVMLPETSYRSSITWENTPVMGIFQVSYKITAGDTTREETRIVAILPIWVIIIMVLLLTIIIVWIILFIRKRKAQKARLVVS